MKGYHFFIEGTGVNPEKLNNLNFMTQFIEEGCRNNNLDLREIYSCRSDSQDISIVAITRESYISVHTYPKNNSFMIDIFYYGQDDNKARVFVEYITKVLEPFISRVRKIYRTTDLKFMPENKELN